MSYNFPSLPSLLEGLLEGKNLEDAEATFLMNSWLEEKISPVQTGAFLSALRAKGMSGKELSSMAKVLQSACPLPCSLPLIDLVDTCGTGGDGADTFNISTAVAFTASACGANVAKHGNRSASGKVGSADVLENLGLNLKAPLKDIVEALEAVGITFLFAPCWHPALVNLAPLRKNLGVRTVFNLLGPLVNPLKPSSQVLGVAEFDLLDPMAEALKGIGLKRAVVVHGAGGIDEASLAGENQIRLLENGELTQVKIDPSDFGLSRSSVEDLKGGDIEVNKRIFENVLKGNGTKQQQDVVALNTALVLWAAGLQDDLLDGLIIAKSCLEEGRAWSRFEELRKLLDNGKDS